MAEDKSLDAYSRKRDFSKTNEPQGCERKGDDQPIFVIQKHDASSLHYDFRLQIGGVLKSWAVPKGPSTDPAEKRLAIQTEDHPLDYADFEGVIPKGQYGGGTVLVWDSGYYENLGTQDSGPFIPSEAFAGGHLSFRLHGQKLRGDYALTYFRSEGDRRLWLLVKMDDEHADARRNPVSTEPDSVLTGRSLEEIAEQKNGNPDDA